MFCACGSYAVCMSLVWVDDLLFFYVMCLLSLCACLNVSVVCGLSVIVLQIVCLRCVACLTFAWCLSVFCLMLDCSFACLVACLLFHCCLSFAY